MNLETNIIGNVNLLMIIVFLLSSSLVFLYGFKLLRDNKSNEGYKIANYLKFSLENVLFQLIAGFICLLLIHELGEWFINKFLSSDLDSENNEYLLTLSVASGLFGGSLIAKLLEWFRKSKNKADENIRHLHDDNCNH